MSAWPVSPPPLRHPASPALFYLLERKQILILGSCQEAKERKPQERGRFKKHKDQI